MMKQNLRRILLWSMVVLASSILIVQPPAAAITDIALKSIVQYTPHFGEDGLAAGCGTQSTSTGSAGLVGEDGPEQGFNYFLGKEFEGKQLNAVQSAAIIGNFMIESGMDPLADNGSHRGIAQWDYADRYAALKAFAEFKNKSLPEGEKVSPDDLLLQLDYAWAELSGTTPDGKHNYSESSLKPLLNFTNEDQLDAATQHIQDNYEGAPGQATAERKEAARKVFNDFGSTTSSGSTATPAVSGTNASCSTVGAVNCDASSDSAGGLSQLRQNVVCLAQAELALWTAGELKPGNDFYKYGASTDLQWCGYFVSYIFGEAGQAVNPNGVAAAVSDYQTIYSDGERFQYHEKGGYVPQPGDIAVYKNGWSHVNIVVSVNSNNSTMTTIGGNEGGNVSGTGTDSIVKEAKDVNYVNGGDAYGNALSGFLSPIDSTTAST